MGYRYMHPKRSLNGYEQLLAAILRLCLLDQEKSYSARATLDWIYPSWRKRQRKRKKAAKQAAHLG